VKILKEMQDDASQYQEFLQEVSIMRKVNGKRGFGCRRGARRVLFELQCLGGRGGEG
jgi:hypothetical protein